MVNVRNVIFTRCDRVAPGLGTTNLLPLPPLLLLPLTVSEFSAIATMSVLFKILQIYKFIYLLFANF
jgi:hypothetical protein